jgi:CRP-like cAMP-binding protein
VFARADHIPPDAVDLYLDFENLGPATEFKDEIFQIIDRIPLFEDMNRHEVECLCRYMQCYGAPRNTRLLREGDEGHHLLIILTGGVDVIKRTKHGIRMVAAVGIGSALGEMSLIDGARRFASCVATEPTDFAVLTRYALNEILRDHPRLGNKLMLLLLQMLARRLRDTGGKLVSHIAV